MQPFGISYTVGVRRRFLPIFRKYVVTGHDTENMPSGARLHLVLADGSQLAIPGIDRRVFKVYPDYRNAQLNLDKLRASVDRATIPQVVDAETDFDAILRAKQEAPVAR